MKHLINITIDDGKIHAFVNMGEDPLQTEPDALHLKEQLSRLDLFVCLDIFMTQSTVEADVILSATSWGEHEGVYENIWGRSIEGGNLENPANEPPEDIYEWTLSAEYVPRVPRTVREPPGKEPPGLTKNTKNTIDTKNFYARAEQEALRGADRRVR